MTIYDELEVIASGLMKEFKQGVIQLVKVTPAGGPIDNPGEPVLTFYELDAVARGVQFKYIRDSLAMAGDLQITSAVLDGVTVHPRDSIDIDGERYKIVNIIPVPAAGTRVVWKFIVRKGA